MQCISKNINMAYRKIVLLILWCELQLVCAQISIPKSLRECYKNNVTFNPPLPLNLRILVDIIQQIEKHSYSTIDMRVMSSSILHRFKFDGIEYQKNVHATDNVLPFSGTGIQRVKHRLIEELIPGNAETLPTHVLSLVERCILHQSISNSILRLDSKDKYKPCRQDIHTQKLGGKVLHNDEWRCPRQQGVILTPYGTIAPGVIIGAIAASLQHQNVAVNMLIKNFEIPVSEINPTHIYNLKYNEEEIDFVLSHSQMIQKPSMWYNTLISSSVKLDNIWLTTIAGELAEIVIYQAPLLGNNISFGATGFWQNTIRPTIYYLITSHDNYDATRAELIGGIDGMIIASYLQIWVQDFCSLRLSQILEMYYSCEGIAFNTNVKACDRGQTFASAVPKTILYEQTYAIAQMLAYRTSVAYISPVALQRMVNITTEKFYTYAKNHLFPEAPCHEKINVPRVEALIVLDGAWSIEYTINFLAILVENLDVSMYGSRIGIIHGTSGKWMLNVTSSPSQVFQTLNNFTNKFWPEKLHYTQVLETIINYLNETWAYNKKHYIIGNLGQVIVLLAPLAYMSSTDEQFVQTQLRQIKSNHPDVHFVYYVSQYNANLFDKFILSNEDYLIKNSNIDAITQYMSKIPRIIRPVKTLDLSNSKSPEFEDYISPSKSITYRMHSYWKRNMEKTLFTLHGFGYGTMKACLWTEFKPNEKKNLQCAELAGYKEIALTDQFKCTKTSICPNVYLRIENVTSLYKCAEIDCKTPDQVRYIIRTNQLDIQYQNFTERNAILFSLSIMLSFGLLIIA